MNNATKRPRIGVVLGGGAGPKTAATIGLLKVLNREGITPDLLVGSGGGALYAASHALGWDPDETDRKTSPLWANLFSKIDYVTLVRSIFSRLFGIQEDFGILDDRKMTKTLEGVYGETTFADTCIPLFIVLTDLKTGQPYVMHQGRLADMARATSAIPIILKPWRVDGRLMIDGATSDPLPISVAIREGCDLILAMGFEHSLYPRIDSFMVLVNQVIRILVNNLLRSSMAFYTLAHHSEIVHIVPQFDRPIHLSDSRLIPIIIAEGARATEEQLPYIKRLLASARD
jgi:NTE family protein